jgi:hypothetical protein
LNNFPVEDNPADACLKGETLIKAGADIVILENAGIVPS